MTDIVTRIMTTQESFEHCIKILAKRYENMEASCSLCKKLCKDKAHLFDNHWHWSWGT